MESETFAFSADINQLLSLIINTVYTNKDVFIREIISNASDALNKIRYESLTDVSCLDSENNLCIKVAFDRENKNLIIQDFGIGMSKYDLVNNLGTIASSGTKKFLENLSSNKDLQLIGQFGVGFYSVFLVADNVTVISKKNNEEQYVWESCGNGAFSIQPDTSEQLTRGTKIILKLKDDMPEYLEENKIRDLIKKHNQFIDFPIFIETQKTREIDVEDVKDAAEDIEESLKDEVKPKQTETYYEFEQLNKEKPLWMRNPKEVSEDEYSEFYKSLTGDYDNHLDVAHFSVEGQVEFKGLLYIPKRAPHDLFDGQKKHSDIKLYVRKVYITDQFDDLIPDYMKFVKGIIETDDVPLNISRELLQQNKTLKVIGKNIVKKILEMFTSISSDSEKFRIFYEQYSKNIKLGVHEDSTNRMKLASLLRFESSKSNGDLISLDEYVENMKEDQKNIYYMSSDSTKTIIGSPFLDYFNSKEYEVLFLVDPLDEYITQQLKDYKDKKLICITKENIELSESETDKELYEKNKNEYKKVCDYFKSTLNDEVEKVIISNRLSTYPCILSTSEYGWTANMQRLVKAQTFGKQDNMSFMMGKKIMEINPEHEIIKKIKNIIDSDMQNNETKELVDLLYDLALQSSGFNIENSSTFIKKVLKLVDNNLSI
jgi:molecular chaperone HtpG